LLKSLKPKSFVGTSCAVAGAAAVAEEEAFCDEADAAVTADSSTVALAICTGAVPAVFCTAKLESTRDDKTTSKSLARFNLGTPEVLVTARLLANGITAFPWKRKSLHY
jgi:hypothetical protein